MLAALEGGAGVMLIATPKESLVTCASNDNLRKNNYGPSDKLGCTNYCDKRAILIRARLVPSV
jgi:hypothetical protein